MPHRKVITGLITLLVFSLVTTAVKAGNDFIVVDLRIDDPLVQNSLDYQVWLAASGGPNDNYPTFTTAWLSVNLDDEPGLYGNKFSQVGLIADNQGIHWFVYAEPGVECWRGSHTYWKDDLQKYLGCKGDINDLVDYDQFYKVELVTYGQGFWIARVQDGNGDVHDVAKILSNSMAIFDADVSFEEGWSQSTDPYEYGLFHFWHPQYNSWDNGFKEWPFSGSSINYLYAYPSAICPDDFGASINVTNDPRYWLAGSIVTICNSVMFPGSWMYLPLILK